MSEERWDNDRANRLLDGALAVLEAAGDWQSPSDADHGDPASMFRFAELYFSAGVRQRIWPHVDLLNRGIAVGTLGDLRLGVLGLLRIVFCLGNGQES
jgi:hypothetical protein